MINIFEKYNRLTDEEKEDLEDLYIVHQLYKQLEKNNIVDLTKLEYKILFNKAKECFKFSNIDVREIIKRMLEILKCVDKTISDIDDPEMDLSEEEKKFQKSLDGTNVSREEYNEVLNKVQRISENF